MSSNKNNSISVNNLKPNNNSIPVNNSITKNNSTPVNNSTSNNNNYKPNNNSKPTNKSSPPLNSVKNITNSNNDNNLSIESQKKLYNIETDANKKKVNGNKVNGNKVNGNKVNGNKVNGNKTNANSNSNANKVNKGNSVKGNKKAIYYIITTLSIILVIVILIFVYINFQYLKGYSKGRGDIAIKIADSPSSSEDNFDFNCDHKKDIFGLDKTDCNARIRYSIVDKTTGFENYITSKREGVEVNFKNIHNIKKSDDRYEYNEDYNDSTPSNGETPKNRSFFKTVNKPGKYLDIYVKGSLESYDNITKEPNWKHDIKILKTSMVKKNIILVLVIASLLLTIILLIMKYQKI